MKTLYSLGSQKISHWLRCQRQHRGLTMRQAGERLGKPHSFIAKTENGQRRLDVVEFVWYCKNLEFDPIEGIKLLSDS